MEEKGNNRSEKGFDTSSYDKKQTLGGLVKVASVCMKRSLDARLLEYDIQGNQAMTLHLIMKSGVKYQKELEKIFHLRRSTMTSTLQILEKSGYLTRDMDDGDARLKKITLTKKAIDLAETIDKEIFKTNEQLVEGLTEEEIKTCSDILVKMVMNLNKDEKTSLDGAMKESTI